jgi:hypothetical protein
MNPMAKALPREQEPARLEQIRLASGRLLLLRELPPAGFQELRPSRAACRSGCFCSFADLPLRISSTGI